VTPFTRLISHLDLALSVFVAVVRWPTFRRFRLSDIGPGDRVACNVFFVWEAARPLLRGATTYIIPAETIFDSEKVLDYLETNAISEVLFTPTLFNNILTTVDPAIIREKMAAVATVYLNGEVVSTEMAQRALAILPAPKQLVNL
jgi:acyl-coenzyme A synthetase/AMP-(fatty) acid ligase